MLLTIIDKITSYILLFGLVANIKMRTEAKDMGHPSMIWVSLFILDFVSTWFTVYSTYLAGPRTEKVSNALENTMLSLYRNSIIGNLIVDTLAELWIATIICQYSNNDVLKHTAAHEFYPIIYNIALLAGCYRIGVFVIELK